MIIAVDFDGTVVEHWYPNIGPMKQDADKVLRKLQAAGHQIILWTCREDLPFPGQDYLIKAKYYMESMGIDLFAVNETPISVDFRYQKGNETFTSRRKVVADMYIDDRNFGGFPGWKEIERWFEAEGLL